MKNSNLIARYIQSKHQQPKQRLEFPVVPQQRKHFFEQKQQVRISHENNEYFVKNARRNNNLDVSDIDGAKPKVTIRSRSQRHVSQAASNANAEYQDQLDQFARKGLHRRDLSVKQFGRMNTDPICQNNKRDSNISTLEIRKQVLKQARQFSKHIKTEPSNPNSSNEILDKYKIVDNAREKRNIFNNPTYLSSLFFA